MGNERSTLFKANVIACQVTLHTTAEDFAVASAHQASDLSKIEKTCHLAHQACTIHRHQTRKLTTVKPLCSSFASTRPAKLPDIGADVPCQSRAQAQTCNGALSQGSCNKTHKK